MAAGKSDTVSLTIQTLGISGSRDKCVHWVFPNYFLILILGAGYYIHGVI